MTADRHPNLVALALRSCPEVTGRFQFSAIDGRAPVKAFTRWSGNLTVNSCSSAIATTSARAQAIDMKCGACVGTLRREALGHVLNTFRQTHPRMHAAFVD